MMDTADRLVLDDVLAQLLEAEAVIERLQHKESILRDMVSVLLTRVYELTLHLPRPFDE